MGRNIISGPSVGEWVAVRIGGTYIPGSTAIGLEKDGEIIAGVTYESWNGKSIMAHMAVSGRLTPAFVAAIFDYAYKVCGVEKVILPVGSTNEKSIRLVENMGFSEEARIRDACPEGDILIYTLSKSACRFLGERFVSKIGVPCHR